MGIPENAQTIYQFLISQGFNANAAAGILGNIEQESGGNPSAGSDPPGSGLIQQLGYPTGTSLQAAMQDIITYVNANGSVQDINSHSTSPSAAALYFSEAYERPGIPDNSNRVASAQEVAAAAASGNWSTGVTPASTTSSSGSGGILGDIWAGSGIPGLVSDFDSFITKVMWLTKPASWLRIAAFLLGVVLLLFAAHGFYSIASGGSVLPTLPSVMPVPV